MAARKLENRTAIVTGGANGIGASIVQRLVDEGCSKVFVIDICPTKDQDRVFGLQADLRNEESIIAALKDITGRLDKSSAVNILVNNAAVFNLESVDSLTEAGLDQAYSINVKGPALMTKHTVPLMTKNGKGGAIVNIASVSATIAQAAFAPYAMSKAAVRQLTRNSAVDLGKYNIRVNSVSPGPTLTATTRRIADSIGITLDQQVQECVDRMVIKRIGTPEDIAAAIAFLVSDDASLITGTDLLVDGGFTLL